MVPLHLSAIRNLLSRLKSKRRMIDTLNPIREIETIQNHRKRHFTHLTRLVQDISTL